MSDASKIEVIFFDLGETLVSSGRSWISGAQALLSEIESRGIGLGVISNTGNFKRDEVVDHLPLDFDFDAFRSELVLLSSEVGIEKPDIRIFEEATRRAGIVAEACLFCTEDLLHSCVSGHSGPRPLRLQRPRSRLSAAYAASRGPIRSHSFLASRSACGPGRRFSPSLRVARSSVIAAANYAIWRIEGRRTNFENRQPIQQVD